MLDFTGLNCPVCGRVFREGDDIVVCPECGAPYHRDCYAQVGECIFGDLHAQGKDWAPPAPPAAERPEVSAEIKDRECPVCGTLNNHSVLFCNQCGASLLGAPDSRRNRVSPGENAPLFQARPDFSAGGVPFAFGDPMGGVSPAEEMEEGLTYGDASKLVRVNTAYYMPVFRYLKQTRRNKFNFAAFLFSGGWFLYRKQYKAGAVITGIMLALYALFLALYLTVSVPALRTLAGETGVDLGETLTITADQSLQLSEAMVEDPQTAFRISSFLLVPPLMLAVMIFCGVRGNKMYRRHCADTLREAKAWGEDMQDVLTEKGGVSSVAALIAAICLIVLRLGLVILLGSALL